MIPVAVSKPRSGPPPALLAVATGVLALLLTRVKRTCPGDDEYRLYEIGLDQMCHATDTCYRGYEMVDGSCTPTPPVRWSTFSFDPVEHVLPGIGEPVYAQGTGTGTVVWGAGAPAAGAPAAGAPAAGAPGAANL